MHDKPYWRLALDTFDIVIIIATVVLIGIAGALGVFSHWPPEQRPASIRYFVLEPDEAPSI